MTTTDGSTGETELNALGVGRALGVLGLLAVLGGLVTILQPSIASDTAFGYGFVTLLGVVILAASLRYWVGLALTTVESATPPPVEERRAPLHRLDGDGEGDAAFGRVDGLGERFERREVVLLD